MQGGSAAGLLIEKDVNPFARSHSKADGMAWALAVLEAVVHLHTRVEPIIHRDLKLENVLLQDAGSGKGRVAVLADFGLSSVRLTSLHPPPAPALPLHHRFSEWRFS